MEVLKNVLGSLADKVSIDVAAVLLLALFIVFILVWLVRKQEESHQTQINSLAEAIENSVATLSNMGNTLSISMGELKGSMDTMLPIIISVIKKEDSKDEGS